MTDDSNFPEPDDERTAPVSPHESPLADSNAAPSTTQARPVRSRWGAVAAWLVIVVLASLIVVGQSKRAPPPEAADEPPAEPAGFVVELQAKYIVGAAAFSPPQKAVFFAQAHTLNTGPVEQRLRYVVLAGELSGEAAAVAALTELDRAMADGGIEPQAGQAETLAALRRTYQQRVDQQDATASPETADQQLLRERLDWFGELAIHPDGSDLPARQAVLAPAIRLFVAMLAFVLGLGGVAVLGLAALVGLAICWGTGFIQPSLSEPSNHGGVYAETFAVWLLLFVGLSLLPALLPQPLFPEQFGLLPNLLLAFVSLLALAWPIVRGVPWTQVRAEIGLTAGRRPWLEPFCGLASYAMMLPLLGVGMLITLFLIQRQNAGLEGGFDMPRMPSHPIVPLVGQADWWGRLQILLLASVSAPIVEEIMFRGVLYRHLRDATHRWRFWPSGIVSALVSSLVFAVIHPQGLATVPALMSIACGLCLAREWRGSLVPGMVAHGLHNGLLMALLMAAS